MDYLAAAAVCFILAAVICLVGATHIAVGDAHIARRARSRQKQELKKMVLIELTVPVQRDDSGWWSNPAIPDFEEDRAAFQAWLKEQGIEIKWDMLEDEDPDHPAYIEYYENNGSDVSAWDCRQADNEGWHTFSINDSDDGPVWVWARRVAPVGGSHV